VLFAALGCAALVFLVFSVRIVLPGCAFQSEFECNLWSSEQIGFKRAREGGREGERGEQEEELKSSFFCSYCLLLEWRRCCCAMLTFARTLLASSSGGKDGENLTDFAALKIGAS
jgi:hypothetical protein